MNGHFSQSTYMVRRKFFRLFGGAFHVYDAAGNVVLYSEMKRFKLKEDIRLYTGEDMSRELIVIKARTMFDISTTYDVFDPTSGETVGALKRKGLKSILKDEWMVLAPGDREIGLISEDSIISALFRRIIGGIVTLILPQGYSVTMNGQLAAKFQQQFNPLVFKLTVDFTPDVAGMLDRRLAMAAAVLLCAVEGRQD